MTLSEDPTPTLESPKPSRSWKKQAVYLIIIALCIFVVFVALPFFPWPHAQDDAQTKEELLEAITMLQQHDNRLAKIEERLTTLDATPTAPVNQGPNATDLTQLQSDVATLSATLSSLQTEMKHTGTNSTQTPQAVQALLASTIAFIQLREAATMGQSFTAELSTMTITSENDKEITEQLDKLKPCAAEGALTLSALHDDLIMQEPLVAQAIDRASAQDSWERIQAELKGLILIRPLHGAGAPDAFSAIESDLSKNDVAAALHDLESLPPEGRHALEDWRTKAEARQTVNNALQAIANHFIATVPIGTATPQGRP